MFPAFIARVCRARPCSAFVSTSRHPSLPSLSPAYRAFASRSSRLPDAFDDIDDRDSHLQPVSERGLTATEYSALTADEQQTVRERELDIQSIEDERAEQRMAMAVEDSDDDYIIGADENTPEPTIEFDSPGNYRTAHPDLPISWQLAQTNNPELIPPLPGSDPSRPTTVRYPFIPVLTGERMRQEASVLHRWLHYNRLRNTKQFLRIERKRRQLERQRQYRDLAHHTHTAITTRLPTTSPTPPQPAPTVRNAPSNVSRDHYERNAPSGYDVSTAWMGDVLCEVEAELRMNGVMSTAEKEAIVNETARVLRWAHGRMVKDYKAGYYRVMPEMGRVAEVNLQNRKSVPVRQVSSTLRSGRVHGEVTEQPQS